MANENLSKAKASKQDEFYTQLSEIQAELSHYTDKFENKVVFCNCDDPFESNFVKYFLMNFNRLKLKELIATGYKTSSVGGTEIGKMNTPYSLRVKDTSKYLVGTQKDLDMRGAKHFLEIEGNNVMTPLIGNNALDEEGNQIQTSVKEKYVDDKTGRTKTRVVKQNLYYEAGDFRSNISIELLQQSDIVVTNPPFSLFREYIALLTKYNKQFLILGNIHAITYVEFFPLLKNNKVWAGCVSGSKTYKVSDKYAQDNPEKVFIDKGEKLTKLGNTYWFTNIDHKKRHAILPIEPGYVYYGHENMYPTYDNYEAIEVSKVNHIPCDYTGVMGVPNSFIGKYCPEQFEIVGIPLAASNKDSLILKKDYSKFFGYSKEGKPTGRTGSTFGACPVFERNDGKTIYYTDGVKTVQAGNCERIFIRYKQSYVDAHPELFKKGEI